MSSSNKEGKRSAVPKFSSFRPTTSDNPHDRVEKGDDSGRSRDDAHQIAKRGHSHHAPDRHRPTIDVSRQPDTHHHKISQRPKASPQELARDRESDSLFIIDKRGDPLIRRYGSNNRHDIPAYRRFGSGRILGAVGSMRIDKSGSREEFFIRSHHENGSLLSGDRKSILARGGRFRSQPVRVRREQSRPDTETQDYVPLRTSRKRKRDGDVSAESSAEEGPSYRSIQGKSKHHHEHSDSDEQFSSGSSGDDLEGPGDDPVSKKSVDLSRRVREHPEDIDAWLELVDHQDVLLQTTQEDGRQPTAAEVKSYADIKLSLLEKALSHVKNDAQQEKMELKIMLEGSKIWDTKTTLKRWADALQKYPGNFGLWKAYMDFRQATLSTFRFEEIKQLYVDRLRLVGKEVWESPFAADRTQLCEQMIYVFLRLTRFISDTGFAEIASAAWQATLELTFARPSTLPDSAEGTVPSQFQDFWESEVPRIGEDQARGWANFEGDGGAQEPPEPKPSGISASPSTRDGYKAWAAVEQHKVWNATIPARTMDDGAEDDPFRVIMFGDLQDLLLYLPTGVIPTIQRPILDAFLVFCHLPPAFCSGGVIHDILRDDMLVRSPTNQSITASFSSEVQNCPDSDEQMTRPPDFFSDYHNMSQTPEVLFPLPHWFKYMRQVRNVFPSDQYQWISTTLKQLTRMFGLKELGPYYLAFEFINEPGKEKKTAKALLKQDATNVDLYLGYSMLEWRKENKEAARNVLSAALGLSAISNHDRFLLGITSAWMELEDGVLDRAVLRLCTTAENSSEAASILEDSAASSAQILKTRQMLSSNRDYLISSGDLTNAIIYAEGLALLEYLTRQSDKEHVSGNQGDIWSAMSSISTCSEDLVSRGQGSSSAHERLLQSAARLLYFHARQGPFKPKFLREQLAKYINFFPQNTIFLGLFAWRETRLSIDDKVRSILDKVVLVQPYESISSHVFAIRHELHAGNTHSTRAAFEHALASEACKNHPGLWMSYIHFCHERKELRSKAKDVFYRAIQSCPWSKDVFMEAFITLGRDMDSSELKSVYNTLCEKGLRVHVEMEDFVEKWRREQKEKAGARRR